MLAWVARWAKISKDIGAGDDWRNGAADGVEGLRKVQANRGAMLGTKDGNIGVGRCLQRGHARTYNKNRGKEEGKLTSFAAGTNSRQPTTWINSETTMVRL